MDNDLCVVGFMVYDEGKPVPDGGVSFLGKIGALDRKKTRMLGVSGMSGANSVVDAKRYLMTFGAEEFLRKPFSDDELIQMIGRMLAD